MKLSPIRFRAETLCSVSHVYAGYGNGDAVRDFTLSVHRGERIALKGENGSGKSSVLELRLKNICRKTAGSGRDRRHPQ